MDFLDLFLMRQCSIFQQKFFRQLLEFFNYLQQHKLDQYPQLLPNNHMYLAMLKGWHLAMPYAGIWPCLKAGTWPCPTLALVNQPTSFVIFKMAENLYENASSLDNVVGTQSSPSGSATSIYVTNLVDQLREELRLEREENARLRKRNVKLEGIIRSGQAVLGTAFAAKGKQRM
ncbi:unnamed protein product [Meloidogyne enterolobii]|uniref:Uncharacterized protein n=2 Tax=Meloidogyne enterolobii TaxID=390850 RepID=A0ACB0YUF4_MELEN